MTSNPATDALSFAVDRYQLITLTAGPGGGGGGGGGGGEKDLGHYEYA